MSVSEKITMLRKQKGLSTSKLARIAGVSQSSLRLIELGRTSPTLESIRKICAALEISPQELLDTPAPSQNSNVKPISTHHVVGTQAAATPALQTEGYLPAVVDIRVLKLLEQLTYNQKLLVVSLIEELVKTNKR